MYYRLLTLLALSASVVATTHDIDVGEDGALRFEPDEVTAKVGDRLKFHFYSASAPHDVVQGSFDAPGPCIPSAPDPFYSGIMNGEEDGHVTFTVEVNSTDPIYFFCSISRHCQSGMVGVVNAPSGKGVAEYRKAAQNVVSSNRPLDGPSGGVVGNDSDDDDDDDEDRSSTSTKTSSGTTTGSTGGAATTAPSTTTTGSAEPTGTGSGTVSGTDAGSAATTTPSGAGKNGKTPVLLGLAVVLGGLVALMA